MENVKHLATEEIIAFWTIVLAGATVLLALLTTVLAFFGYITIRHSHHQVKNVQKALVQIEHYTRFSVHRDIMLMLDKTHEEREIINQLIEKNEQERFEIMDLSKAPEDVLKKAELIIRDWDKIGLMWESGVIPEEVLEFYSRSIVSSFLYFSNRIFSERTRKSSDYRRKFQILFQHADTYRHEKKGHSLHDDLYNV